MSLKKIDPNTYQPLGYRVLVRDDKVEERVNSIYIPDSAKKADEYAQQFGTIAALGPLAFTLGDGGNKLPLSPHVGDYVNYSKYSGVGKVFYEDEDGYKYRILNDEDVLGVLERRSASVEAPNSVTGGQDFNAFI